HFPEPQEQHGNQERHRAGQLDGSGSTAGAQLFTAGPQRGSFLSSLSAGVTYFWGDGRKKSSWGCWVPLPPASTPFYLTSDPGIFESMIVMNAFRSLSECCCWLPVQIL